jgi:hypothetical protein
MLPITPADPGPGPREARPRSGHAAVPRRFRSGCTALRRSIRERASESATKSGYPSWVRRDPRDERLQSGAASE